MSFDERLRNHDEKKKNLSSWESDLKEREEVLSSEKQFFSLEQENKELKFQLQASEIKSQVNLLIYKVKSDFKDSILEQLKSLYAAKLGHVQMMHEKAIILKDIDIAFLEKSAKLQDKIYLAEKLFLEQRLTISQERAELEQAGFHNRIEALQAQNHRLNDIQRLQLENVKKQFLKRLVLGEMALMQSDMDKQHLMQKSAINELIQKGQYGLEEKRRRLDEKVQSTQKNLERMQVIKERIERTDSLQMLREYDQRVADVYRNQKYFNDSAKQLASFQKDSPEWKLWHMTNNGDEARYGLSQSERKKTLHKLTNLLERNSWDYRSLKYLDQERWDFIDSRT